MIRYFGIFFYFFVLIIGRKEFGFWQNLEVMSYVCDWVWVLFIVVYFEFYNLLFLDDVKEFLKIFDGEWMYEGKVYYLFFDIDICNIMMWFGEFLMIGVQLYWI